MRVTLKQVNKAIAALGGKEELVKGNGYYYFIGGDADSWFTSSVQTSHLNNRPLQSWVEKYKDLKADPRNAWLYRT